MSTVQQQADQQQDQEITDQQNPEIKQEYQDDNVDDIDEENLSGDEGSSDENSQQNNQQQQQQQQSSQQLQQSTDGATNNNQDQQNNSTNALNPNQQQSQNPSDRPRKRYSVITQEVREKFIERVLSRQVTIKAAAKEFGIKFSTSKAILQTYKREGRTCKKKTRQRNNPTRIIPSTLPSEPNIFGMEDIMDNHHHQPYQQEYYQQVPSALDADGNNPNQTKMLEGSSSNLGGVGKSNTGMIFNKLRFGKGLQINTGLNVGGNFKVNFPQKQSDVKFPNPFEKMGLQQYNGQIGFRNFQEKTWDIRSVENQLKNIDVEVLKSQAKTSDAAPIAIVNDFNYNKYFSDVY